MSGKVMLLTGASSGIGLAAALELARQGAELTVVCRDAAKADRARDEIRQASGNPHVVGVAADLLLLREVRRLAEEFAASHARLDVLVNNAGSAFPEYAETEDGLERTMALNYFSPFLLTQLLLPLLERSAPSRVVNVSSVAHANARLDLGNLNGKGDQGVGGLRAYGRSKLALVLFTYELARRAQGRGVTSNCLHPGAVRTGIWGHAGKYTPLVRFFSLFMMGPTKGARTTIYLATSPEVAGVSGKYFVKRRPVPSSTTSQDVELAGKLWEESLRRTGLPTGS